MYIEYGIAKVKVIDNWWKRDSLESLIREAIMRL